MNRKRIAGVAAGVIGLGGLASLSPGITAHALPPSVTVTNTAAGAAPSASAEATCPAGSALVGTGGKITGGAGQVVMTDVIPNVAAGTVTVWGVEKVAFAGAWSVSAYAVCDAQIANVVRVGVASPLNGNSPKTVNPMCPANKVLTGVGYQLLNANGQVFPNQVTPNAALNGAQISATASAGFGGAWSLTGYAICATVPAGAAPQRVALAGPINMASPKSVTTPVCQAGKDLVGLGGELVGGAGNVILDQITPNAQLTSATTRGNAFAPANWGVIAYGVCW